MGISRGIAALLLEEHRARPFQGRLLELGRQDVGLPATRLRRLPEQLGLPPSRETGSRRLTDWQFFATLGLSEVHALDISAYEGADIVHDLNDRDCPPHLAAQFDIVFDAGTLEHVFHVPNALHQVCRLLRPGGRVIHACPASNAVEHGYYSLSPAFFNDYYDANRFDLLSVKLVRFGALFHAIRIVAVDARPPLRRDLVDGAFTSHVYYTFVVARKTDVSRCDAIPQQSWFRERWKRNADVRPADSLLNAVRRRLRTVPILSTLLAHGVPGRCWVRQMRCRLYLERRASRH